MTVTAKPKACRVCRDPFTPRSSFAVVCSPKCAMAHAHAKSQAAAQRQAVRERREAAKSLREARAKLMTRRDWIKRAQTAVNAYVRARDAHLPCVSCGRWHEGQWHAGHYRSTKAAPELRLNPLNIHRQCSPCNSHLSGNLIPYRVELIRRIGLEQVEWLEGPHAPARYTIHELQALEAKYKTMTRDIKALRAA